MRSSKPASPKKTNMKLKDLKTNKEARGDVKPSRPNRDGLWTNHNEMFLADVS